MDVWDASSESISFCILPHCLNSQQLDKFQALGSAEKS